MINLNEYSTLGIGAIFAALAAGWAQVKNAISRITGILIITAEFTQGFASQGALAYCQNELTTKHSSFAKFTGRFRFIRPKVRQGIVFYEEINPKGQLYWKGWRPIWVSHASSSEHGPGGNVIFHYLRGTFDQYKLAFDVSLARDSAIKNDTANRFRIIRKSGLSAKAAMSASSKGGGLARKEGNDMPDEPYQDEDEDDIGLGRAVGWKLDDIGEQRPKTNPVERLALSQEILDMVGHIKRWYKSKDWYVDRQIPWKFGGLLWGPPGTGKSSLAKSIAQDLKIPLVLMDISSMDNEEFHAAYRAALAQSPCVVLIEDIDAVFHGRENVAAEAGTGLSFDCFLNTLSGVENSDGLLLLVTTNNLDKIDPALGVPKPGSLSSRPGRIDRAVEMTILTESGRIKIASRIMAGCHESWVNYLVNKGIGDSGAQFEDRCATAALALYWGNDPNGMAPMGVIETMECA